MSNELDRPNRKPPLPLDPDISNALRELAGWPRESAHQGGFRSRVRVITVQRDHLGRVLGSVETTEEHEYEDYSHDWAK